MNDPELQAGDFVTKAVRLLRPLAEGGMGRVWVAEHLGLRAEVVVKLMAPEIAARPDGAERFAREAAASAAVKGPHVVQVFDHGVTAGGTPYIVMELLEGRDLAAQLAAHGRLPLADVLPVVTQVGKALTKAHGAGIIHRDIKPENIFLCDTEGGEVFVKLLDFGTARQDTGGTERATVPGQIMGTPHYMSPEQSVGAPDLDASTDVWSLGVVAFEALTGQRPFEGSSVGAIALAIHGPLPSMTALVPELPPALDGWFARACAQDRRERFATVREATRALVEAATGIAPIDGPTSSLALPTARSMAVAPTALVTAPSQVVTSTAPVSAPVASLVSTLPDRRSERRFTAIAAGSVMVAAALAMAAIVLGRGPAPAGEPAVAALAAEPDEATPSAPESAHDPASVPAPEHAPPPVPVAAPPAVAAPARSPKPVQVASGLRTDRAKPTRAARATGAASAPRATPSAATPSAATPSAATSATKEGLDDDLVRLTTATAKQVERAEEAAIPPAAGTSSAAPERPAPPTPAPSPEPVSPEK